MSDRNYWQRMKRNRMSRRALLRASGRAGVGAAGLALVGCGDDDDDGQAVAQTRQQQQQQQQAMQQQQQAMQQQQQAMQQEQQEQQADQAAQQAEQEEQQTVAQAQQQQQQQQAAAPLRTYGGTLKFSTPAATHDFFDPHRGVFGPTTYWMGFYMNYLIRWGNKEKGIVESDISSLPEQPDGETYIFNIDRGASWWDQYPTEGGRMVTAQDVDINFDRQIAALDADGNPDARFRGQDAFRKTVSKEAPDEQTFMPKLTVPTPPIWVARSCDRSPGLRRPKASRSSAAAGEMKRPTSSSLPARVRSFRSATTPTLAFTLSEIRTTGRTAPTGSSCPIPTPWISST